MVHRRDLRIFWPEAGDFYFDISSPGTVPDLTLYLTPAVLKAVVMEIVILMR